MNIKEMRKKTMDGAVNLLRTRIRNAMNIGFYQSSVDTNATSLTSDEINTARKMLRENYEGCDLEVHRGDNSLVFVVDWSRKTRETS